MAGTYTQVDNPVCAKCGGPMEFMKREVVTAVCRGVLFKNQESEHDYMFTIDDEYEVARADEETWWVCNDHACHARLARAGEDFPYEREF